MNDQLSPESLGLASAPSVPAAEAEPRRVRKTPEERLAEVEAQFLKVHKTLAPVGERRQDALEMLDPLRDRVRVALGKLSLADHDVDALIEGYVTSGLTAGA